MKASTVDPPLVIQMKESISIWHSNHTHWGLQSLHSLHSPQPPRLSRPCLIRPTVHQDHLLAEPVIHPQTPGLVLNFCLEAAAQL